MPTLVGTDPNKVLTGVRSSPSFRTNDSSLSPLGSPR